MMMARKLVAIWLLGSVLGHAQASDDCREIRKIPPEGTSLTMAEPIDTPTLVKAWDDKSNFSIVDTHEKNQ
jgi:hypothetical protein